MISLDDLKAKSARKLWINYLPTKAEFDASLSTAEQNNFCTLFATNPNKATSMVNTKIRQLAESKVIAYIDAQVSAGSFTLDDVRMLLD